MKSLLCCQRQNRLDKLLTVKKYLKKVDLPVTFDLWILATMTCTFTKAITTTTIQSIPKDVASILSVWTDSCYPNKSKHFLWFQIAFLHFRSFGGTKTSRGQRSRAIEDFLVVAGRKGSLGIVRKCKVFSWKESMMIHRPLDALKDGCEFPRVDKMTTYLKMRKNSRWEFHLYLVTYDNGV